VAEGCPLGLNTSSPGRCATNSFIVHAHPFLWEVQWKFRLEHQSSSLSRGMPEISCAGPWCDVSSFKKSLRHEEKANSASLFNFQRHYRLLSVSSLPLFGAHGAVPRRGREIEEEIHVPHAYAKKRTEIAGCDLFCLEMEI